MTKHINKSTIDLLSLILVLSFFISNNIIVVFIGIILALYCINRDYILKIIKDNKPKNELKEIENEMFIKKEHGRAKELIQNISELTLVEAIEEFGFIPSKGKELNGNTIHD